jgi:hypothetical protein
MGETDCHAGVDRIVGKDGANGSRFKRLSP